MMYLNTKIGAPAEQHAGLVDFIWTKLVGKGEVMAYCDLKLALFTAHGIWQPKWMEGTKSPL